ncbi:hypothetical protein C8J56DRAFT_1051503 [Mycena floridula]|nr:hypothetical protein C8J56DRAFT_1051503 [Mycena floridula]
MDDYMYYCMSLKFMEPEEKYDAWIQTSEEHCGEQKDGWRKVKMFGQCERHLKEYPKPVVEQAQTERRLYEEFIPIGPRTLILPCHCSSRTLLRHWNIEKRSEETSVLPRDAASSDLDTSPRLCSSLQVRIYSTWLQYCLYPR